MHRQIAVTLQILYRRLARPQRSDLRLQGCYILDLAVQARDFRLKESVAILLSSDLPFGQQGPSTMASPDVRAMLRTPDSHVANLAKSTRTGNWVTRISVPVHVHDTLRYRLVADIDAQTWQEMVSAGHKVGVALPN